VKCLDIEWAIAAAKKREEADGRHVNEEYIRLSQQNRALHFVNAAVALRDRAIAMKTSVPLFVSAIRRAADGDAQITVLSAEKMVHCSTDDEAQALLDLLCASES